MPQKVFVSLENGCVLMRRQALISSPVFSSMPRHFFSDNSRTARNVVPPSSITPLSSRTAPLLHALPVTKTNRSDQPTTHHSTRPSCVCGNTSPRARDALALPSGRQRTSRPCPPAAIMRLVYLRAAGDYATLAAVIAARCAVRARITNDYDEISPGY